MVIGAEIVVSVHIGIVSVVLGHLAARLTACMSAAAAVAHATAMAAASTAGIKSLVSARAPNTDWNPSRREVSIKRIFFIMIVLHFLKK